LVKSYPTRISKLYKIKCFSKFISRNASRKLVNDFVYHSV
jgi:hypothetical protein